MVVVVVVAVVIWWSDRRIAGVEVPKPGKVRKYAQVKTERRM